MDCSRDAVHAPARGAKTKSEQNAGTIIVLACFMAITGTVLVAWETALFVARSESINNTQMMLVQSAGFMETRKIPTENHYSFLILYPSAVLTALHNSCDCHNEAARYCRRWESAEYWNSMEPGDVREGALPTPSPARDFL